MPSSAMSSLNHSLYVPARELALTRPQAPPLGLRIRVLFAQRRLDRMLAEGADPAASAQLSLRARQLISAPYRRTLADGLDEILCIAEGDGPRVSASPKLASRDVQAARGALLELSHELRREGPVRALGVALAQRLLADATGALYVEAGEDALWHALRRATAALEPQG